MQLRSVLAFNKAFLKNMYMPSTVVQGTDVGTYVTDSQGGGSIQCSKQNPGSTDGHCPAQGVR